MFCCICKYFQTDERISNADANTSTFVIFNSNTNITKYVSTNTNTYLGPSMQHNSFVLCRLIISRSFHADARALDNKIVRMFG